MSKDLNDVVMEAISQQAAEWWVMHREGMTDAARQAFVDWLRRSQDHVAAYLAIACAAQDLREAARSWDGGADTLVAEATRPLSHAENVVPLRASAGATEDAQDARPMGRSPRHPLRILSAIAAVIVFVMVAGGLLLRDGERFGISRAYETAHAEQGSWRLPDGSVLHLNSDSRAVVRYAARERLVTVERGQAMFQVAKEAQRRFRVDAGDAQIIALGTEFDVYRRPAGTRVVVLEGRVAVVRGNVMPGDATLAIPEATPLSAGEQIDVRPVGETTSAQPADIRRAGAWLQREIVFDSVPLGSVVEDFNRYSSIPLEVQGEDLKALQISGVFGAYDVESFVAFLRRLDGVRVEEGRSRILICPTWAPLREPVSVHEEAERPTPAVPSRTVK